MKTLKLSAFILAAVLLMGFGTTTLSASDKSVKSEKLTLNIDGKVYDSQRNCKCEKCECGMKKGPKAAMKCGAEKCGMKKGPKAAMKCGAGKCGDAKKTSPKKVMKCGAGKCGSK